jgi:hypothetical protein
MDRGAITPFAAFTIGSAKGRNPLAPSGLHFHGPAFLRVQEYTDRSLKRKYAQSFGAVFAGL